MPAGEDDPLAPFPIGDVFDRVGVGVVVEAAGGEVVLDCDDVF